MKTYTGYIATYSDHFNNLPIIFGKKITFKKNDSHELPFSAFKTIEDLINNLLSTGRESHLLQFYKVELYSNSFFEDKKVIQSNNIKFIEEINLKNNTYKNESGYIRFQKGKVASVVYYDSNIPCYKYSYTKKNQIYSIKEFAKDRVITESFKYKNGNLIRKKSTVTDSQTELIEKRFYNNNNKLEKIEWWNVGPQTKLLLTHLYLYSKNTITIKEEHKETIYEYNNKNQLVSLKEFSYGRDSPIYEINYNINRLGNLKSVDSFFFNNKKSYIFS